jgi:hypothetical protein
MSPLLSPSVLSEAMTTIQSFEQLYELQLQFQHNSQLLKGHLLLNSSVTARTWLRRAIHSIALIRRPENLIDDFFRISPES